MQAGTVLKEADGGQQAQGPPGSSSVILPSAEQQQGLLIVSRCVALEAKHTHCQLHDSQKPQEIKDQEIAERDCVPLTVLPTGQLLCVTLTTGMLHGEIPTNAIQFNFLILPLKGVEYVPPLKAERARKPFQVC